MRSMVEGSRRDSAGCAVAPSTAFGGPPPHAEHGEDLKQRHPTATSAVDKYAGPPLLLFAWVEMRVGSLTPDDTPSGGR
jgi:hypothetical protein